MAARSEIVVTLAGGLVDAGRPMVFADDPTFTRGDGVFETLLVRDGHACLLEAHLARLARSATITGLPRPDLDRWRAAVAIAETRLTSPDDAVMRLVLGRGRGNVPSAFVAVSDLPERIAATRRDGVSAVTLDRGVAASQGADAPWSIAAAKSLSYAVNAAALRHADRLGAGDVVFVGSDGFVLEGPRSSVVIQSSDGQLVTPPPASPILAGTTVNAVFETAEARGVTCVRRRLLVSELLAAQGVWLLSSITLAARVHTLDGTRLPAVAAAIDMAALVDEAIAGPRRDVARKAVVDPAVRE